VNYVLAVSFVVLSAVIFAAVLYGLLKEKIGNRDALNVFDGNKKPMKGIPFYVKKGRYIHETSYLETLVSCIVTATKVRQQGEDKPEQKSKIFLGSKTVSLSSAEAKKLGEFENRLAEAQQETDPAKQSRIWNEAQKIFQKLVVYDGKRPSEDRLPVVGNTIRDESYVDYKDPHYINATQPVIGSTDFSAKLGADGTLSESSAKISDTTIEKLIDVFPVGDVVTSILKPEAAEVTPADVDRKPEGLEIRYEFRLEEQSHYIRHILYEEADDRKYKEPISWTASNKWYRREYLTGIEPDETKKEAEAKSKNKDK
jgi:hypothetical protein